MTDRIAQLQYEQSQDNEAAAERLAVMQKESAEGSLNLPRAQRYIARAYGAVRDSLEAALAIQTRGVGGKYKGWLRKVPLDVAAVLALRECISITMQRSIRGKPCTIQALGIAIGQLYELEVRIADAEKVNPMYMKRVHDQAKENAIASQQHLRKLYSVAHKAVMKEGLETMLTQTEIIQLGKFGVQACLDAGVLVWERHNSHNRTISTYELAPEVQEFLSDYKEHDVQMILNKSAGAMRCVPDRWTNLSDGGYLSPRRKMGQPLMSLRGIRKSERARIREQFTEENMPRVFAVANYLQETPYEIHRPTVDCVIRQWTDGGGAKGIPTKNPPVKPAFPFGENWVKADAPSAEQEVFSKWKRSMSLYYTGLTNWRSKVREIGGFIKTTSAQQGKLYFPVFFDTRGRWYYRGYPNPQGSDIAKAGLHFAEKRALGERGLFWLKVHIANCYGYDKKRFAARAQWVDDNIANLIGGIQNPEDSALFQKADSPWCMYSAAYELAQALGSGDPASYKTGIIIHMDATCSGLQHFSAMARDPVGGSYVNLNDAGGDEKQDIYARVGMNAMAVIAQECTSADENIAAMANWWFKVGIPRGMAKNPVMTYCYGATLRGVVEGVQVYLEDEMDVRFPDDVRPYDYAQYAAKKLFQGIAATVPAAENLMHWLRCVAKQVPKGKRMEWTTPIGFKVQHDYQDYTEHEVKLRSCNTTHAIVREFNEDTKPLQMASAISPNFVHALDATHLSMTVERMRGSRLHMAAIHDSFGTHPSDVDTLHVHVRDSFIDLYGNHNVMADFLWEVEGIGEVPMRGTLDLREVANSEFFFC